MHAIWGRNRDVENTPLFAITGDAAGRAWAVGDDGIILAFDGQAWEQQTSAIQANLRGITCTESGQIFAVGAGGVVISSAGEGLWEALYNIWGVDDTHILAIGDFGLVLRWNGENWAEFYAGTENFLFDIWGDALDNIFIVGLSGTLAHFDSKRWNLTPTRARDDLMAIDGIPGYGPYAVGTQDNILHYDAGQWQPEVSPTTAGLRAVCACANGIVYAAGN